MLTLKIAGTESEKEACYKLRYEILRKPWQQARGSETDALEDEAITLMLSNEEGILGTGRLHFIGAAEAQIRYMAVREDQQGSGMGSILLDGLEKIAAEKGASKIILNARENAVRFYLRHGYQQLAEVETLYGQIRHFRMEKIIYHAG